MDDKTKEVIGYIIFIGLLLLYGIGFVCGNNTTVTSTRQTLCREFMKETSDYINCNTKGLDDIVKMIKEQTNKK